VEKSIQVREVVRTSSMSVCLINRTGCFIEYWNINRIKVSQAKIMLSSYLIAIILAGNLSE
jgi:hypothetical protein